jgi:6-phosphogluconolactonase
MKAEVLADPEAVARRAAAFVAGEARSAARDRGRFLVALSGGTTPLRMLELLAGEDIPWPLVHVFQVDERIVEASDPARNFSQLRGSLLGRVPIPAHQIHPMPVDEADLRAAAARYATTLKTFAGIPPRLDLVHLGLGDDGHTASLVPGDPALAEVGSEVALTGSYRGFRRMTLTYPVLDGARRILWLVTGPGKTEALLRLCRSDRSIPAGGVSQEQALLLVDEAAVKNLPAGSWVSDPCQSNEANGVGS